MIRSLKDHQTRPGMQLQDVSSYQCSEVAKAMKAYCKGLNLADPIHEALEFYLLNHIVAEIGNRISPNTPLRQYEPFVDRYHDCISKCGIRLFYYLISITTREARHVYGKLNSGKEKLIVQNGHPKVLIDWLYDLHNHSGSKAMHVFHITPPNGTIGEYSKALLGIFSLHGWGGAYGGKKWAVVTDAWKRVVEGSMSFEMLLDHGYSLAHNGGPIFNKGTYYKSIKKHNLVKVLNAQRDGRIPEYVQKNTHPYHVEILKSAREVLGPDFGIVSKPTPKKATHIKKDSHKPLKTSFTVMPGLIVPILTP
jgi:hypothetical protein